MFIADSYTDLPYNCLGIFSLITTNVTYHVTSHNLISYSVKR